MPKKRNRYPSAYRRQIVALAFSGWSPEVLAREFEPSASTIRNWIRQADIDAGHRSDEGRRRAELHRLKRKVKRLRLDRDKGQAG